MIFTVNIQKSMIMIESRKKIIITMIEIAFYKLNKKTKFPARRAENSTQNRTVTSVSKILHDPKTLTNKHTLVRVHIPKKLLRVTIPLAHNVN